MNIRRLQSIVTVSVATVCLAGCATEASVTSRLDSSGYTIATMGDAIVLSRPTPQLAAAARDYAYVGPVEINHMGKLEHYLWVGLASTVDRKFDSISPDTAEDLVLLVDGQPMLLPLKKWNTSLDQMPYSTIAPMYATLSAHASLDQIKRIASSTSVEVHIVASDGTVAHYRMWQGDFPSWSLLGKVE